MVRPRTEVQTDLEIELLQVALRAVGVVLPGVCVLGIVELRGEIPEGDFGTFPRGDGGLPGGGCDLVRHRRSPDSKAPCVHPMGRDCARGRF
jgi:hypothetical protein